MRRKQARAAPSLVADRAACYLRRYTSDSARSSTDEDKDRDAEESHHHTDIIIVCSLHQGCPH